MAFLDLDLYDWLVSSNGFPSRVGILKGTADPSNDNKPSEFTFYLNTTSKEVWSFDLKAQKWIKGVGGSGGSLNNIVISTNTAITATTNTSYYLKTGCEGIIITLPKDNLAVQDKIEIRDISGILGSTKFVTIDGTLATIDGQPDNVILDVRFCNITFEWTGSTWSESHNGILISPVYTDTVKFAPSTTGYASMNIPKGIAPVSPNVGDFWGDVNGNLKYQIQTDKTLDIFNSSSDVGDVKMTARLIPPNGWMLCLTGDSEVLLSDGTTQRIDYLVNNKINANVIAYDENTNKMSMGKIVDWMKNPSTMDEWVRLNISKGNGFGKRSLTLTKNHPVLTQRGWVEARDLCQDTDIIYRYEDTLSDEGAQALLGIYLGDGTFDRKTDIFVTRHGKCQEAYARYIKDVFNCSISEGIAHSGFGSEYVNVKLPLRTFAPKMATMLKNSKKKVTKNLLNQLGDIGLAFWYMDDGSLSKDNRNSNYFRANLHTEGFDNDELLIIQEYFEENGINTVLYQRNNTKGKMLCIKREHNDVFFNKIAKYIHPSMQYKIPQKYQTQTICVNGIKKDKVEFNFDIRELKTYSLNKKNKSIYNFKYDIKVDNLHSFVANGFIVHNCDGASISRTDYKSLFDAIGTTYGLGDGSTTFNVPDMRGRIGVGAGSPAMKISFVSTNVDVTNNTITLPESYSYSLYTGTPVVFSTTGSTLPPLVVGTSYFLIKQSSTLYKLATSSTNATYGVAIDLTGVGTGNYYLTTVNTREYTMGQFGGEETHVLSTGELPPHDHAQAGGWNKTMGVTGNNTGGASLDPSANEVDLYRYGTLQNVGSANGHNNMMPYTVFNYIIKY